jgi:hypothetical protein
MAASIEVEPESCNDWEIIVLLAFYSFIYKLRTVNDGGRRVMLVSWKCRCSVKWVSWSRVSQLFSTSTKVFQFP